MNRLNPRFLVAAYPACKQAILITKTKIRTKVIAIRLLKLKLELKMQNTEMNCNMF